MNHWPTSIPGDEQMCLAMFLRSQARRLSHQADVLEIEALTLWAKAEIDRIVATNEQSTIDLTNITS